MQGRQKSKPRKQRSHSLHQLTPAVRVYQVPWSHEASQTNSWKSHVSPAGELLVKHANSFNHICVANSSCIWWLGLVLIKTRVSVMCLKTGSHLLFVRRKKKKKKKERKEALKTAPLFLGDIRLRITTPHFLLLKYCHSSESFACLQPASSTWAGLANELSASHPPVFGKRQGPELCFHQVLITSEKTDLLCSIVSTTASQPWART